jgi:hypothetical protein
MPLRLPYRAYGSVFRGRYAAPQDEVGWISGICARTQREIRFPRNVDQRGIRLKLAFSLFIAAMLVALPAEALEWRWSYQGEGVAASGAFTTKDAPNAEGFYEITGIKGEANGVAITGLQPAGTSIPGNDGYPVDGLVRVEAPQLSLHGFGYALADGTYANPFYGDHFVPPGVYAFFSDPAKRKTSEPLVRFTATMVP